MLTNAFPKYILIREKSKDWIHLSFLPYNIFSNCNTLQLSLISSVATIFVDWACQHTLLIAQYHMEAVFTWQIHIIETCKMKLTF